MCHAVIIGAGPCGIFTAFQLGIRGISSTIIDCLPSIGGQCSHLYPGKPIYDIPGYSSITGQSLIDNLYKQITPIRHVLLLNTFILSLQYLDKDDTFLCIDKNNITVASSRYIIFATGSGVIKAKKLNLPNADLCERNGFLLYHVDNVDNYRNFSVVISGGGDSALDWALVFAKHGIDVTLVHRSYNFRAFPMTINHVKQKISSGEIKFICGTINAICGTNLIDKVVIRNTKDEGEQDNYTEVRVDKVFVFHGLAIGKTSLIECEKINNRYVVETDSFQTSIDNIYAIGDCNHYKGKLKLILSGFHESALASQDVFTKACPESNHHLQYTTTSKSIQSIICGGKK